MKIKIHAEHNCYSGGLNVREDGYLTDTRYDGEVIALVFSSVAEAATHLTGSDTPDDYFCEHDGDGVFSVAGAYECSHGQYSRPRYTLVSATSGRSNKAIRDAANALDTVNA